MIKKFLVFGLLYSLGLMTYDVQAKRRAGSPSRFHKRTGVGVLLGAPTGLSVKHQYSFRNSIDFALAWSLGSNDAFHLHSDYLFHRPTGETLDGHLLYWYYGVGARLKANGDTTFGPRAPIGLNLYFRNTPLELFLEAALVFEVIDETDLDLDAGIGLRYFF